MSRVALVTGGSRGIGRAISMALAARGNKVAVNYARRSDTADETVAEIRARGGTAEAFRADVSRSEEVTGLFARIAQRWGRPGHPRQQRRDNRGLTTRPPGRAGLGAGDEREPPVGLSVQQGGSPRDATGPLGADSQRRIGRRPGGQPGPDQLRGLQGGVGGILQVPCQGGGGTGHHRERRGAGIRPDRLDRRTGGGGDGTGSPPARASAGSASPRR